jgi:hypothetical protein
MKNISKFSADDYAIFILLFYFSYLILRVPIEYVLITNFGLITEGTIINEKNSLGGRVSGGEFTYSYEFEYKGKLYRGNSHDSGLELNRSIDVVFVPFLPSFNKPARRYPKIIKRAKDIEN